MSFEEPRVPPEWGVSFELLIEALSRCRRPTVTVQHEDGSAVTIQFLQARDPAPPAPTPPPAALSEMESTILEALGADTLTGQQIADRAGYPYEAGLRAALAGLRRRGILGGATGSPGYFVANP